MVVSFYTNFGVLIFENLFKFSVIVNVTAVNVTIFLEVLDKIKKYTKYFFLKKGSLLMHLKIFLRTNLNMAFKRKSF